MSNLSVRTLFYVVSRNLFYNTRTFTLCAASQCPNSETWAFSERTYEEGIRRPRVPDGQITMKHYASEEHPASPWPRLKLECLCCSALRILFIAMDDYKRQERDINGERWLNYYHVRGQKTNIMDRNEIFADPPQCLAEIIGIIRLTS